MIELCRKYKFQTLEKKVVNRILEMAEMIVTQDSGESSALRLLQTADKHKMTLAINRLAECIASKYHFYEGTLKRECECWKIGNQGLVKIMACMTEKNIKENIKNIENFFTNGTDSKASIHHVLATNHQRANDIEQMQKYISKCNLE